MSWLLMSWLLVSPGHQPSWYCHVICESGFQPLALSQYWGMIENVNSFLRFLKTSLYLIAIIFHCVTFVSRGEWHWRLSLWQLPVPPMTAKLTSWQFSVFNAHYSTVLVALFLQCGSHKYIDNCVYQTRRHASSQDFGSAFVFQGIHSLGYGSSYVDTDQDWGMGNQDLIFFVSDKSASHSVVLH